MKFSTVIQILVTSFAFAEGAPQPTEGGKTPTRVLKARQRVPTDPSQGGGGNGGSSGNGVGQVIPWPRPTDTGNGAALIGNCNGLSREGCWANPLCEWDRMWGRCIAWI